MNTHQLFRYSRLRLALWYAGAMAIILSLSGFTVYRFLIQSNWNAMESELESIAGTLHDSLEPMLPTSGEPTKVLKRILPELCLVDEFCQVNPTLIERHTTGISDRNTYYIRLFNYHHKLLAFTPSQPSGISPTLNLQLWQTFRSNDGIRYHQFTIMLHSQAPHQSHQLNKNLPSWGYLQIGRKLASFDAEINRLKLILIIGFFLALILVIISSLWLSGLAMQPIYQSYQQQQQFTANAAHELRSPLASLLATVEAMLHIPPSKPQDLVTMLETLERQGRRLNRLITDLLFLSNLEQNSSTIPFRDCCLNDLINDLTEEFLELAIKAKIELVHHIPQANIYVLGNESQLYRLVSNLISNAINYTPSGGQITLSLITKENKAIIKVKDTGIGIDPSEINKIWDRFYRINSDRSRQTGGTGLGLAIARAIAHKHQAILKVESELQRGSIFILEMSMLNFDGGFICS
ncbi:GHKL domain-containing protein [Cylindrospermopsis raciborskii CHAB3438]|uniref:two-component system sensor histidine kinase RppB n=1 Tax=Cylindrospermopsis raciborskii TaxID=77022 RepID=UPI001F10A7EF|nr:two-component system sensor histidine kinase RppB [Cylindrospermopsis raciborskii]MCH4903398.1 GHKL domain-containing protein [Cylindrospermopsis raciborskii CHAB3438]MEB3146149.1 two-component system sensor histidine kinase RppB [Cylindrospermopsis raciborskii]